MSIHISLRTFLIPHQLPQSVISKMSFWGPKNCSILQVVAGKLADGGPQSDMSMGIVDDAALEMDNGIFGRYNNLASAFGYKNVLLTLQNQILSIYRCKYKSFLTRVDNKKAYNILFNYRRSVQRRSIMKLTQLHQIALQIRPRQQLRNQPGNYLAWFLRQHNL